MDEKKPLWVADGVAEPEDLASSAAGLNAEIELDSLLGLLAAADAERTRLWEIMFPEGLTTMPVGKESFDFSDSGESVTSASTRGAPYPLRRSTGVGGVTVVTGAGIEVCGGVFGVGLAGSRGFSSVRSVRIGGGKGGRGSVTIWSFCAEALALLLLLLFENKLRPLLPPLDFTDPRSELLLLLSGSSLSLFELNVSFNRLPGETPLFFPLRSFGMSSVEAGCVDDLERSVSGLDSDPGALFPLAADSISVCMLSSGSSADLECISGEEEV